MFKITVDTEKKDQVLDITRQVQEALADNDCAGDGVCHIFIAHTTAALTTADLDPGTDLDMLDAFRALMPDLEYRHPHNPSHAPDHILATLLGPSVTVPVQAGKLVLGTWQRVVLFEFDGPRDRTVVINVNCGD
jgi:secondary thiamine-phosphate synthase enzyme